MPSEGANQRPRSFAKRVWIALFVRYGAGAGHLAPIANANWSNKLLWSLIVLGVIGWALFLFWPYDS